MSEINKRLDERDANQITQATYNRVNATSSVDGFLVTKVGAKVELALSTTSVTNDTETYSFSDSGNPLYAIKIIYTDGTRSLMISAERIS